MQVRNVIGFSYTEFVNRETNVTLQAFLRSLRDLETRRLPYQANFLFFDVFRNVKENFIGVSVTFETVRSLTRSLNYGNLWMASMS
jgi:hypothetical protein